MGARGPPLLAASTEIRQRAGAGFPGTRPYGRPGNTDTAVRDTSVGFNGDGGAQPAAGRSSAHSSARRWRCREDESGVGIKKKQRLKITLVAKTTTAGARFAKGPLHLPIGGAARAAGGPRAAGGSPQRWDRGGSQSSQPFLMHRPHSQARCSVLSSSVTSERTR